MKGSRRAFCKLVGGMIISAMVSRQSNGENSQLPQMLIIDTHQHLWDLSWQKLPWLEGSPQVLRRSYVMSDYLKAIEGCTVQAIYMEVDVAEEQLKAEAEHLVGLIRSGTTPTKAAVIGARPADDNFAEYLAGFAKVPEIKGVRQVLHVPSTPAGYCLSRGFIRGVQQLAKVNWSFDLCMRPGELQDAVRLVKECPDTRFILDHCGNADPTAFRKSTERPSHDPLAWRRAIEALAKQPNVICKVSGIVARAPKGWTADDLAPIVEHCWDCFGPDRVVFGGDWPVCLLGSTLREWIAALHQIARSRPEEHQRKLWYENARRFYGLA